TCALPLFLSAAATRDALHPSRNLTGARPISAPSAIGGIGHEPEQRPPCGRRASVSDDTDGALVDRVMAIAHLPHTAHVAVIGHHTLPLVVALLRRGSEGVRSLRPGSPAPDCEPVDLAWIVDLQDERELDG